MQAATLDRARLTGWALPMGLFALATCVESLAWNQLNAFTPLYLRELGVHPAAVPGWTAAMSSLGWVLALPLAPFWGVWADRYSRKAVIVRSAVVEGIIFGGSALAQDPVTALVLRCLSGFILGNTGVMLAMQASATPATRLGLAVGVVGAGAPLGRAVGPALGALLIHQGGVRGMLVVDAAASFLVAGVLVWALREPARERPRALSVLQQLREALGEITGHALVWRLFVAMTIASAALWVVYPFVPILIGRRYLAGFDAATAIGLVLSASAAASAIASPLWGRVIDRHGHVRVLTLTSVASAVALVAAGLAPGLAWFAGAFVLYGAASVAIQTSVMALLARVVSPERRGAVLGQVLFPFYVGGLVGPLVGSLLLPAGQVALFTAAGLLTLAPILLIARAPRR